MSVKRTASGAPHTDV